MKNEKIIIVADHREYATDCFKLLNKDPNVELKIKTLLVGDYETDTVIFERKTLVDLDKSIIDGRLFQQMRGLLVKKKRTAFIIEGLPEQMGAHGVAREAVQGAIITLSLIHGISVFYSLCPNETVNIIIFTARQENLVRYDHVFRPGFVGKTKIKRQLYFLQGFPSIGPLRAKWLLDYFGSVKNVVNADLTELVQVKGIGKSTALSMQVFLD